jgi:hypothetical protein
LRITGLWSFTFRGFRDISLWKVIKRQRKKRRKERRNKRRKNKKKEKERQMGKDEDLQCMHWSCGLLHHNYDK